MKWLIITDNEDIQKRCSDFISKGNRKDKVVASPLTIAGIKTTKKYFKELAACIIFANDDVNVDEPVVHDTPVGEEVPKTYDGITNYFTLGIISMFTLLSTLVIKKRFE